MDKRILFIAFVGYCLMIVTYTLGFIEKYNMIIGLIIFASIIVFVLLILKHFLTVKKGFNQEESLASNNQTIKIGIQTNSELTSKDITRSAENRSSSSKQSIADGAVAGRDIHIEKIRQKK